MKEIEAPESIYLLLPRFVTEEDNDYAAGKYLPAVIRDFEWENLSFRFVISPARVRDESGEDRHYYPGRQERVVETALRQLAVEDNANFRSEESTLDFTQSQLMNEIYSLSRDSDSRLKRDDVDLSIRILADVKYELISNDYEGSELYFRPIERLVVREINGEVYYRSQLSELFFRQTEQFDFCFPGKNAVIEDSSE
jgi:hypothetical protein